jgi:glucokinase
VAAGVTGAGARGDGLALVADIGGTNVRFALADPRMAMPLVAQSIRSHRVGDFASLTEAARRYLADGPFDGLRRGVFAIAAPIAGDDEIRMTNHPWTLSRSRLQADLGLEHLSFVNDFAATSRCIPLLAAADVRTIGAVADRGGDRVGDRTFVVVGPGTGLGVGVLLVRGGRAIALETEGGHIGFAPRDALEIRLLEELRKRHDRVSNERLLCGPGLANLHDALRRLEGSGGDALEPEEITRRASAGDPPATRTLRLFCELFGSVAGDLALAYGAWDGVYLAGGLTPGLVPWLERGGFRRRFVDKGRYARVLEQVPVAAILHPQPGLLGAAAIAVEPPAVA